MEEEEEALRDAGEMVRERDRERRRDREQDRDLPATFSMVRSRKALMDSDVPRTEEEEEEEEVDWEPDVEGVAGTWVRGGILEPKIAGHGKHRLCGGPSVARPSALGL